MDPTAINTITEQLSQEVEAVAVSLSQTIEAVADSLSQEINAVSVSLSQKINTVAASLDALTAPAVQEGVVAASQFHGTGGALTVSLIAFTIVFAVLAALCSMIYVNRYIAMIVEKKDTPKASAPSAPVSASAPAPAPAPAPVSQTQASVKDMKKTVAAISAAITAATGRSMNVISVTPVQGNSFPNMTPVWRVKGIAECIESRLSSRSW